MHYNRGPPRYVDQEFRGGRFPPQDHPRYEMDDRRGGRGGGPPMRGDRGRGGMPPREPREFKDQRDRPDRLPREEPNHLDEYRPQRGGLRGRGRGRGTRGFGGDRGFRGDRGFGGDRPSYPARDGDKDSRGEANVRQRTRGGDPDNRD